MTTYETLKLAHLIGAAVLFGTGLGIAFFMLMANRTRDPAHIAATAGHVVLADTIFTAVAVVVQPLTGAALVHAVGYPWDALWVWASLVLYFFVGCCWLPVVWIQVQMKALAEDAARAGGPLPAHYDRLYRIWFALGWPAFIAVIAIIALMITRPA